MRATEHGSTLT